MTEGKHTLDDAAMSRLGRRLQEARLAMGYSTGGLAPSLMAARTQLEDIESGRSSTFYSPHYYLSLFQRYAAFLGFPPEAIAAMVDELKGLPPPAAQPPEPPVEQPLEPPAAPPSEPILTEELPPEELSAEAPAPTPLVQTPESRATRPPPASTGLGDRLLVLLALLAVAAVAWVLLSEQGARVAPASTVQGPAAPPEPIAPPSAPPATPSTPLPAPAADTPPPPPSPASAVAGPSTPDTAALVLRFPEKSWIWVRRADDSVSEVVIAPGSTLRFEEMPIYMVLPRPAEIQVTVRGRKTTLSRNDTERDMGRFTRSMLEQAAAR